MAGGAGKIGEYQATLTKEQRKEQARIAGKKSAEKRAMNKSIKEILLNSFHNAEVGKDKQGNPITGADFTASQIVAGIKKGDYRMLELYLAMIGQKPSDKMEVSGNVSTNTELRGIMRQLGGDVDDGRNGED